MKNDEITDDEIRIIRGLRIPEQEMYYHSTPDLPLEETAMSADNDNARPRCVVPDPDDPPTKEPEQNATQMHYHKPKRRPGYWIIIGCLLMVMVVVVVLFTFVYGIGMQRMDVDASNAVYEPQIERSLIDPHPLRTWLYSFDNDSIYNMSGCAIKDTVVNDIPIRVYLPLNAHARLQIGTKCLVDENTILAFQAADIRADNFKIVGAFVEAGKPVSWGISKKGFCAIIDDVITVGMSGNSPLFELATDREGYFFRQYPLVADGIPQHSELRSQSIRRALCDVNKHIVVIETQVRASMHDFSQLLTDIGVDNAIYLIGGDSYGVYVDLQEKTHRVGTLNAIPYKYTNYIYWSKE